MKLGWSQPLPLPPQPRCRPLLRVSHDLTHATHRSDTLGACGFGHGAACRGLWMGPWGRGSGTHATGDLLEAGGAPRQCRGWHRAQSQTQTRDPASGPERGTCVGGVRCWFGVGHRLGVELVVRGRRLGSEGTVGSQTRSGSEVGTRGSTCTGRQVAGALLGSVPPGAVRQAEAGAAAPSREHRVRAAPGAGGPWGPRAPATWGDGRERRLPMSQPWAPGLPGSRAEEAAGSGLAFP